MKDIDFDELDKAVSSLMKPQPKTDAEEQPAVAVTTESEAQPSLASSVSPATPVADVEPQPVSLAPPTEAVSTLAATPVATEPVMNETPRQSVAPPVSRGRFMDMVRPGVRDTTIATPSARVSRQGVTLTPAASPSIASPAAELSTPVDEPVVEEPADTPDLEALMQSFQGSEVEPATSAPGSLVIEESSFTSTEETAPLSSPFLADAKVEKRPLGRPTEAAQEVQPMSLQPDMNVEPAENPFATTETITPFTESDAQLPEQPLPAELGSELLAVETGVIAATQEETVVETTAIETDTLLASPAPELAQSPISESARAAMTASIPQQYKVQAAAPEEGSVGAIYDTQPLAHTAEKKPGWMTVVIVVVILLLGAGGGAAVYYLGLL